MDGKQIYINNYLFFVLRINGVRLNSDNVFFYWYVIEILIILCKVEPETRFTL